MAIWRFKNEKGSTTELPPTLDGPEKPNHQAIATIKESQSMM
jgi:hypothetical protein